MVQKSNIFSNPTSRLEVIPLGEINIPALRLLPLFSDEFSSTDANGNCLEVTDDTVCVNIYAHYGSLLFNYVMNDIEIKFDSNSKKSVTLMSTSLMSINRALEKMTYKSTQYEPTGSTDVITLRYGPHKAQIPVEIKYPKQTILIDPKSGSLDDMVTICIKTFERYPCLNRLITSIRKYYPTIRIIVADDSINFKQITFDRLDHFKMPPGIGFNNGKNLAISQVIYCYLKLAPFQRNRLIGILSGLVDRVVLQY